LSWALPRSPIARSPPRRRWRPLTRRQGLVPAVRLHPDDRVGVQAEAPSLIYTPPNG